MYKLITTLVGTALSFAITRLLVGGFQLDNSLWTFLTASILFILINFFVSPLLKLIFLPINILTLGLFRWVINLLVLYLFDLFYSGLTITAYDFGGYSNVLFTLPPGHVSLFMTLLLSSLAMSLTYTIFSAFFHNK